MKKDTKQFSINDIQEVSTEESDEFFYAKICALSTMPNSHKVLITKDILKRDGESIRGKWIVADASDGEFMTHTENEMIVGIIPQDANIEFVDDDEGYTSMYVDAILSKLYGKQIYEMFKQDNQRNVSVEMITDDMDIDEFGNIPIRGFKICGVTILGKFVNGSCPNANMMITKFSTDEAKKFYDDINKNSLRKFAEERKEKLTKTYKVDKTEIKDTAWGNVDKTSMRNKIMKSKNRGSLVKDVYAQVLNGWEDSPSEDLKYPLMQLVGDTFYYNRGALSSALAYAKQHNDSDVVSKVEKLYKKFKLDEPNKEDNMADTQKKPTDDNKKEDDIIMDKDKKEMSDHEQNPEDAKKMGCGDGEKEIAKEDEKDTEVKDKEEDKEDKEEDKEDKEEDKEDKEEPKKFSLDAYADVPAIMAQLEHETDANKELAKKIMAMDAKGIVDTVMSFAKENDDLKKFKAEKEEEEKQKKLSQIMAAVKGDIDPKKFSELQEEGSKLSVGELNGFENKVKAFAYESSKGRNHVDDEFMRFASNDNSDNQPELTADEIYKKYL